MGTMNFCPKCGDRLYGDSPRFCGVCGSALPRMGGAPLEVGDEGGMRGLPAGDVKPSNAHLARTGNSRYVAKILDAWDQSRERWGLGLNDDEVVPGDVIALEEVEWWDDDQQTPMPPAWQDGVPSGWSVAEVVVNSPLLLRLKHPQTGEEVDLPQEAICWSVVESSAVDALRTWALGRPEPEGVAYADGAVTGRLRAGLRHAVQRLVDEEPPDYHPGSGTRVRDLVHPSLYPFVAGRSMSARKDDPGTDPAHDRFGRPFERSRFQWLPTRFDLDGSDRVTIGSYVNNLSRDRHPQAYDLLSQLFEAALPLFESVLGYVDETTFWVEGADDGSTTVWTTPEGRSRWISTHQEAGREVNARSLAGRSLQVIPKIVEYRLKSGDEHAGVWHVEGMSHEHIIATCVYVLERDEALIGGDLEFRRPFTIEEAVALVMGLGQDCLGGCFREMVDTEGALLGSLAMPEGRMVVFPNSHVHRLTELRLAPGASEGRRRVVVFWLVDPDVEIHDTSDVEPQHGLFSEEEAMNFRLELMEERRLHKQSHNPRLVNLCEH